MKSLNALLLTATILCLSNSLSRAQIDFDNWVSYDSSDYRIESLVNGELLEITSHYRSIKYYYPERVIESDIEDEFTLNILLDTIRVDDSQLGCPILIRIDSESEEDPTSDNTFYSKYVCEDNTNDTARVKISEPYYASFIFDDREVIFSQLTFR